MIDYNGLELIGVFCLRQPSDRARLLFHVRRLTRLGVWTRIEATPELSTEIVYLWREE